MIYTVVLVCAGSGTRSGLEYNKMFFILDKKTVYEHAISLFLEDDRCNEIIVVCKGEEKTLFNNLITNSKIKYVQGGKERQNSVYNGLSEVSNKYVLIHDGARPYLLKKDLDSLLECLVVDNACALMVPCVDTIKLSKDGFIEKTLDRNTIMMVQTPQAFDTKLITSNYFLALNSDQIFTDDCSIIEHFSDVKIRSVIGSYSNIKVTNENDFIK